MLHVDAAVGPVSVMFSGAKEPIAAAGQTAVFGKLAVARQATAPPETYKRRLLVGRCRDVEIEVRLHSLALPAVLLAAGRAVSELSPRGRLPPLSSHIGQSCPAFISSAEVLLCVIGCSSSDDPLLIRADGEVVV